MLRFFHLFKIQPEQFYDASRFLFPAPVQNKTFIKEDNLFVSFMKSHSSSQIPLKGNIYLISFQYLIYIK